MNTQKQIVLIVAMLFIFVGGCAAYSAIELPVRAPDQADWTRDQSLERGALLFANNCRTCHGNKGQGGVGPQLLNNELTKFQDQEPLTLKNNRTFLTRTLACGRAGTLMPAWLNTNGGSLNAIQIQHLVDFLSSPIEVSDDGEASSHWWEEAVEFAHNLNGEVAVLVGGDTLSTIAASHNLGANALSAANSNMPIYDLIKKGTEIKIPGFKGDPNGYTYTVYKDNETIAKIAESQHVGALILADLNNIPYKFTEKRGVATIDLKTADGKAIAGLFPGSKLKLPEGATYTIQAGDTLEKLATKHGISISAIVAPNRELLGTLKDDAEIPFERRLKLPTPNVVVQAGQTLAAIADDHDLKAADLATANGLEENAVLKAGQQLNIPAGTEYVVQAGDTWALVAQEHATTAAELAKRNNTDANSRLSPDVIIAIPQIDGYIVQGQDLAAIAEGYGNVTAASLADANGIKENTVLAVNTQLKLPADAFGSSAPDAKNPGTACVEGAVTRDAFSCLVTGECGGGIQKPTAPSTTVEIVANANDWTVIADGKQLEPNAGGALIAPGTTVNFRSAVGLHTITVNSKKDGANFNQGDTRAIPFADAGEFKITCDFHPDMLAQLWVE